MQLDESRRRRGVLDLATADLSIAEVAGGAHRARPEHVSGSGGRDGHRAGRPAESAGGGACAAAANRSGRRRRAPGRGRAGGGDRRAPKRCRARSGRESSRRAEQADDLAAVRPSRRRCRRGVRDRGAADGPRSTGASASAALPGTGWPRLAGPDDVGGRAPPHWIERGHRRRGARCRGRARRASSGRPADGVRRACSELAAGALTDAARPPGSRPRRPPRPPSPSFDDRRQRLAVLRERVDGLTADAQVAEQLGHLLRADGFEAWLMQAALEELVDAATVRLRELSGGQFSLELVEREFMVRDHANADELRSARTLSGGETFLASLSLALALADATAELSRRGCADDRVDLPRRGVRLARSRTRSTSSPRPSRSSARPAGWSSSSPTSASSPIACRCASRSPRPARRRPSNGSRPDALQRRVVVAGVRVVDRGRVSSTTCPSASTPRSSGRSPTGRPIVPAPSVRPDRILFVDGVRRIDARMWIHDGDRALPACAPPSPRGSSSAPARSATVTDGRVRAGAHRAGHVGGRPRRHATRRLRARADRRMPTRAPSTSPSTAR